MRPIGPRNPVAGRIALAACLLAQLDWAWGTRPDGPPASLARTAPGCERGGSRWGGEVSANGDHAAEAEEEPFTVAHSEPVTVVDDLWCDLAYCLGVSEGWEPTTPEAGRDTASIGDRWWYRDGEVGSLVLWGDLSLPDMPADLEKTCYPPEGVWRPETLAELVDSGPLQRERSPPQAKPLPDLTVSVAHEPSLFSPGKPMTYVVTYGNAGRRDAKDVVLTTTLPVSTTHIPDGWHSSDDHTYAYTVGDLLSGDVGNTITYTVKFTDSEQIGATEVNTPFTIVETGSARGDANPDDNAVYASIGVPDLVVEDFAVEPLPVEPGVPVTFTIRLKNQGSGWAWNPDTEWAFYVDVFIAPVSSYPFERYSEKNIYDTPPPLEPGGEHTLVLTHDGFTEQELLEEIRAFYVKVDNHALYPYGLVPESNEMNNVGGPLALWSHHGYLPLVQKE